MAWVVMMGSSDGLGGGRSDGWNSGDGEIMGDIMNEGLGCDQKPMGMLGSLGW